MSKESKINPRIKPWYLDEVIRELVVKRIKALEKELERTYRLSSGKKAELKALRETGHPRIASLEAKKAREGGLPPKEMDELAILRAKII